MRYHFLLALFSAICQVSLAAYSGWLAQPFDAFSPELLKALENVPLGKQFWDLHTSDGDIGEALRVNASTVQAKLYNGMNVEIVTSFCDHCQRVEINYRTFCDNDMHPIEPKKGIKEPGHVEEREKEEEEDNDNFDSVFCDSVGAVGERLSRCIHQ